MNMMMASPNEISDGKQKTTAFSLLQEELLNGCILSYNENLDSILKHVIVPQSITELTGYPGSGKTQVCFQLCISVQLPKYCGGYGGAALYINTNRNFAAQRLTVSTLELHYRESRVACYKFHHLASLSQWGLTNDFFGFQSYLQDMSNASVIYPLNIPLRNEENRVTLLWDNLFFKESVQKNLYKKLKNSSISFCNIQKFLLLLKKNLSFQKSILSDNSPSLKFFFQDLAKDFTRQFHQMGIKKDPDVDLNEKTILKNIHCIKIDTTLELLACLTYLRQYLVDKNIRLIVIDSVSYLLRQLDVSNRIVVISKIFLELRVLAEHFNFAVILTNDFTTRVDGEVTLVTPSFGDSFYHLVNSRIILSKTGFAFRAKLVKSIFCDCKEVEFNI